MSNESVVSEATAEELDERALTDGTIEGELADQEAGEEEEEAVVATPTLASTLMCALLLLLATALFMREIFRTAFSIYSSFCALPRAGNLKIARSAACSVSTCL
jgi:hypothetical protein